MYQIDGKRYCSLEEFKSALPENAEKIRAMHVFKGGSADEMLSTAEKAEGKNGVVVVLLKK